MAPDVWPDAVSRMQNLLLTLLHWAVMIARLCGPRKTRAIFDRYNIINEQHAQAQAPRGRAHPTGAAVTRTAPPLRLVRRTTA